MIQDEILDKMRDIIVKGEKPRLICMSQKQMKQLQHELDTKEEILRYHDIEISATLPNREGKEIHIITERNYRMLIDVFAIALEHLNVCEELHK